MAQVQQREPVRWLNYHDDVDVDFASPMGPNTMGERLWPVTSSYDPKTNVTRVGLSYVAPPAKAAA